MLLSHHLTPPVVDIYRSSAKFDSSELAQFIAATMKVWGKVWGCIFPNLVIAARYKGLRPTIPGISYPRILR